MSGHGAVSIHGDPLHAGPWDTSNAFAERQSSVWSEAGARRAWRSMARQAGFNVRFPCFDIPAIINGQDGLFPHW